MKDAGAGAPIRICCLRSSGRIAADDPQGRPGQSLSDMRGKTIAIPSPFSNENFFMQQDDAGSGDRARRDQVRRPTAAGHARGAVREGDRRFHRRGAVSAARPRWIGYGRVLYYAKDVWPNYISCCLVVHDDLIRDKPEVVRDLVRGIVASGEWAQKNRRRRASWSSPYFGQNEKLMNYVLTQPPDRVTLHQLEPQRRGAPEDQWTWGISLASQLNTDRQF